MKQYHDALRHTLENGEPSTDRTGVGTIRTFGYMMRFNLQEGFPAVTTKKLAFNAVKSELLWFIEGSTDERRLCEILYGVRDPAKKTIWTANANSPYWRPNAQFEGDLQHVYGYQWRKWNAYDNWKNTVTLVKQNAETGVDSPFFIDFPTALPSTTNVDDFVGRVFNSKNSGDFLVLEKLPTRNGNTYYRVQFLSGIKTIAEFSRPNIKKGTVKNPYAMLAANGSGCYGIITKKSAYLTKAYNMWLNMMERCHGTHPEKTLHYKQKGIFVDSNWRCFSNFYRDIHALVGFEQWKADPSNYDLDKDYFGNQFYGAKTTIFLPSKYNMHILTNSSNLGHCYTATNKKTGEIFKFTSPAFFNSHTNTRGVVDRALRTQHGETKTWKFTKENPPEGYKWRQQFYVDQLKEVINQIKTNPDSRRIILSAWNPVELSKMALPPCHVMAQFSVINGVLNCMLTQRSVDLFLGCPFNIASYSLLTHMIAHVCDLKVGEFIHNMGDAHIYYNHIDAVKEQLAREPLPLPKLWLNPEVRDIEKFTMDDIKLLDYQCYETISAPMAV